MTWIKGLGLGTPTSPNESSLEDADLNNNSVDSSSSIRCCLYPHSFKVLSFEYEIKSIWGQNAHVLYLLFIKKV